MFVEAFDAWMSRLNFECAGVVCRHNKSLESFGCLVVWLFGCLVVWLFGS